MTNYDLRVAFDEEKAKCFQAILKDLRAVGVKSVILNVSQDKQITIAANNETRTLMHFVEIKPYLIDKSEITDDFKFGIYDISEFTSLVSIFKDGFGLSMNDKIALMKKGRNSVRYYGCVTNIIKQAKMEEEPPWVATMEWGEDHSEFTKALSIIQDGFVIITGDSTKNQIKMSITDKDVKKTSFDSVFEGEVDQNFKVILHKEILIPAVKSSLGEFTVSFHSRVVKLEADCDCFSERFYIMAVK